MESRGGAALAGCMDFIQADFRWEFLVGRGGSDHRGTAGEALVLEFDEPVGGRGAPVSGAVEAGWPGTLPPISPSDFAS